MVGNILLYITNRNPKLIWKKIHYMETDVSTQGQTQKNTKADFKMLTFSVSLSPLFLWYTLNRATQLI